MSIQVACADYLRQDDKLAHIETVIRLIDQALVQNFSGHQVVLRGIQSDKSTLPKQTLLKRITETGTDRTKSSSENEAKVSNQPIDLFGLETIIQQDKPIVLPILEGFHKWAPKSLERPQYPVDVWMVYDAEKLENVTYEHVRYHVMTKDGWTFKDPEHKAEALMGIIEVV